jgi:hypothetical protein
MMLGYLFLQGPVASLTFPNLNPDIEELVDVLGDAKPSYDRQKVVPKLLFRYEIQCSFSSSLRPVLVVQIMFSA